MNTFLGIIIYLIGLISPIVYKKIENKYSENKDKNIEDYRKKICLLYTSDAADEHRDV